MPDRSNPRSGTAPSARTCPWRGFCPCRAGTPGAPPLHWGEPPVSIAGVPTAPAPAPRPPVRPGWDGRPRHEGQTGLASAAWESPGRVHRQPRPDTGLPQRAPASTTPAVLSPKPRAFAPRLAFASARARAPGWSEWASDRSALVPDRPRARSAPPGSTTLPRAAPPVRRAPAARAAGRWAWGTRRGGATSRLDRALRVGTAALQVRRACPPSDSVAPRRIPGDPLRPSARSFGNNRLPRARGEPCLLRGTAPRRVTPACAGRSARRPTMAPARTATPRVRGAIWCGSALGAAGRVAARRVRDNQPATYASGHRHGRPGERGVTDKFGRR